MAGGGHVGKQCWPRIIRVFKSPRKLVALRGGGGSSDDAASGNGFASSPPLTNAPHATIDSPQHPPPATPPPPRAGRPSVVLGDPTDQSLLERIRTEEDISRVLNAVGRIPALRDTIDQNVRIAKAAPEDALLAAASVVRLSTLLARKHSITHGRGALNRRDSCGGCGSDRGGGVQGRVRTAEEDAAQHKRVVHDRRFEQLVEVLEVTAVPSIGPRASFQLVEALASLQCFPPLLMAQLQQQALAILRERTLEAGLPLLDVFGCAFGDGPSPLPPSLQQQQQRQQEKEVGDGQKQQMRQRKEKPQEGREEGQKEKDEEEPERVVSSAGASDAAWLLYTFGYSDLAFGSLSRPSSAASASILSVAIRFLVAGDKHSTIARLPWNPSQGILAGVDVGLLSNVLWTLSVTTPRAAAVVTSAAVGATADDEGSGRTTADRDLLGHQSVSMDMEAVAELTRRVAAQLVSRLSSLSFLQAAKSVWALHSLERSLGRGPLCDFNVLKPPLAAAAAIVTDPALPPCSRSSPSPSSSEFEAYSEAEVEAGDAGFFQRAVARHFEERLATELSQGVGKMREEMSSEVKGEGGASEGMQRQTDAEEGREYEKKEEDEDEEEQELQLVVESREDIVGLAELVWALAESHHTPSDAFQSMAMTKLGPSVFAGLRNDSPDKDKDEQQHEANSSPSTEWSCLPSLPSSFLFSSSSPSASSSISSSSSFSSLYSSSIVMPVLEANKLAKLAWALTTFGNGHATRTVQAAMQSLQTPSELGSTSILSSGASFAAGEGGAPHTSLPFSPGGGAQQFDRRNCAPENLVGLLWAIAELTAVRHLREAQGLSYEWAATLGRISVIIEAAVPELPTATVIRLLHSVASLDFRNSNLLILCQRRLLRDMFAPLPMSSSLLSSSPPSPTSGSPPASFQPRRTASSVKMLSSSYAIANICSGVSNCWSPPYAPSPDDVATVAVAFARLGHPAPVLLGKCCAYVTAHASDFETCALARVLWALASTGQQIGPFCLTRVDFVQATTTASEGIAAGEVEAVVSAVNGEAGVGGRRGEHAGQGEGPSCDSEESPAVHDEAHGNDGTQAGPPVSTVAGGEGEEEREGLKDTGASRRELHEEERGGGLDQEEQEEHFFALLPNLGGDRLRELNPSEASKLHWALATALVVPPRPVLSEESNHELTISSFSPTQGLVEGYGQDCDQHENAESSSETVTGTTPGLGMGLGSKGDDGADAKVGEGSSGAVRGGGGGVSGGGSGSVHDGGSVPLDYGVNNVLYEGLFASLHEDLLLKLASFSPQELVDTAWAVAKLQRRLFHGTKLEDGLLVGAPTVHLPTDGLGVSSGADGGGSGGIGGESSRSSAMHLVLPRGDEVMDRIALAITSHWDLTRFSSHQLTCLAWAFANWAGSCAAISDSTSSLNVNEAKKYYEEGENYSESGKTPPMGSRDNERRGEKGAMSGAGGGGGICSDERMDDVEEEIINMEGGVAGDMEKLGSGSVGMTAVRTELVRALGAEASKRLGELSSTRSDVYYAGACRQWVDIYLAAWARNAGKHQSLMSGRVREILFEPAHMAKRFFRIFSQP